MNNAYLNLTPILALATKQKTDAEFAELGIDNLSDEIAVALKEALISERKEAAQAAAQEILKIVKMSRSKEEELVAKIRAARRAEAEAKSTLKKIAVARAYAQETSNYLPLFFTAKDALSNPTTLVDMALRTVPEGFIPSSDAATASPEQSEVQDSATRKASKYGRAVVRPSR